jgi:hypothetical protein
MKLNSAAIFFGCAFVALGGGHLLAELGGWDLRTDVLLPVILIIGGLGLAVSGLIIGRRTP